LQAVIKQDIESIIHDKIISCNSISGGCINIAEIILTKTGKTFFIKSNNSSEKDMFLKEANGLRELAKANTIRIPEVIYAAYNFIIIENISPRIKIKTFWENFGRDFARLHKFTAERYGFYEDNYIGSTPQLNIATESEALNWVEFYFNKRLSYQYQLAVKNGYVKKDLQKVFSRLENKINLIIDNSTEQSSLLHGDLWSGNFITDENGNACLIDPAVYYGHREADLAMTRLFGGFDNRFYSAYNEEFPLENGYEYRENIYKLYHVLNHLNLFGTSYYQQVINLINFYL
jgi:fructosamine-3-kinase